MPNPVAVENSHGSRSGQDSGQRQVPVLALIAGYFLLQLLSRVFISDTANLDEAEQLILTQEIRWGYASQPPLYTWLQSVFFTVFGLNIFALALLKNLLIFGTYFFTYLSAKQVTGRKSVAAMAALSLLFIPQIVWETQRDLTHSVLTTTLAAATVLIGLKLVQTRQTRFYFLLGVCAALGLLSKYNYAVFLGAFAAAAVSLRSMRPAVWDKRLFLTTGVFLLITAPHIHWIFTHNEAAFTQSEKLLVSGVAGSFSSYGKGLASLVSAAGGFFLPLGLVTLLVFRRENVRRLFAPKTEPERLLFRLMLFGLCFCFVAVFCFNARFKERWMQPLFFVIPLYVALCLEAVLTPQRMRRFGIICALVAAAVLIGLPLDPLSASIVKSSSRLNAPYSALANELKIHFQSGLILAESRMVGGNLKRHFSESVVNVPELTPFPAPEHAAILLVWDATKKPAMPAQLARFAASYFGDDLSAFSVKFAEAPLKFAPRKKMRLGFVFLPAK